MNGFWIKHIQFEDENGVTYKTISFSRGLNYIMGPSDIGKTLLYDSIQFCLRSKSATKRLQIASNQVPEVAKCKRLSLTLSTYNTLVEYTISRSLVDNKDIVLTLKNGQRINIASSVTDPSKPSSLEHYIKPIVGFFNDKVIRKLDGSSHARVTVSNIAKILMCDEQQITGMNSPLYYSGNVTNRTPDIATICEIISQGSGQFGFGNSASGNDRLIRKSALKDLIDSLQTEREALLAEIEIIAPGIDAGEVLSPHGDIPSDFLELRRLQHEVLDRETTFRTENSTLQESIVELQTIDLISRKEVMMIRALERQLKSTIQLDTFRPEGCPTCGSIEVRSLGIPVERFRSEQRQDLARRKAQLKDLTSLTVQLRSNLILRERKVLKLQTQITSLKLRVSRAGTLMGLAKASNSTIFGILNLKAQYSALSFQIDRLEDQMDSTYANKQTATLNDLLSRIDLSPLKTVVENFANAVLTKKPLKFVTTSDHLNLILEGQRASSFGQGVRGVLALITLTGFYSYLCSESKPSLGFMVVDSPFSSYYEGQERGAISSKDVATDYFSNATSLLMGQIIIIDNRKINNVPGVNIQNLYNKHGGIF